MLSLDQKFEQLVMGKIQHKSANLGCNLLITRLQRRYAGNPTPAELRSCVQEANAFFEKFSSVMAKDVEMLKNA